MHSNSLHQHSSWRAMWQRNAYRVAMLVGLTGLLAGCQSFSNPLKPDGGRISLKDAPAAKRQPKSLESLTGISVRDNDRNRQPPTEPRVDPSQFIDNAMADAELAAAASNMSPPSATTRPTGPGLSGGLNLDQVTLSETPGSNVHVEQLSINDIEQDAETQLPAIVESAVHPLGRGIGQALPTTVMMQSVQEQTETPAAVVTTVAPPLVAAPITQQQTQTTSPPQPVVQTQQVQQPTQPAVQPTQQAVVQTPPASAQPTTPTPVAPVTPPLPVIQTSEPMFADDPSVMKIVAHSDRQSGAKIPSRVDSLFATPNAEQQTIERKGSMVIVQPQQQIAPNHAVRPASHVQSQEQEQAGSVQPIATTQQATTQQATAQPATSSLGDTPAQTAANASLQKLTWEQQLNASIRQMEQDMRANSSTTTVEQQVRLHLLKMVSGEQTGDQFPVFGASVDEQQFWQSQLNGINMMLAELPEDVTAAARLAASRRRATMAAEQLELASSQLSNNSTLRVRNCSFCTEVRGFGQYSPISTQFTPGQRTLIYCEIDNYSLRPDTTVGKGQFVAELKGQYSIVDDENRIVYQYDFQPVKDVAQNRRKDFYMFFPVTLPNMAAGHYRLQLSIEDLVGNKVASSRKDLDFIISQSTTTANPVSVAARPQSSTTRQPAPPTTTGNLQSPASPSGNSATGTSASPSRQPAASGQMPLPINAGNRTSAPRDNSSMPLPMKRR